MSQQQVDKVNDARTRWLQVDNEASLSRSSYLRHLEVAYEHVKELSSRQSELLVAILQPVAKPTVPVESPTPTVTSVSSKQDTEVTVRPDNVSS